MRWLLSLFMLFSSAVFAQAPAWKIVPAESTLTFAATQNGAPVTGAFKKFSGEINFDLQHLDECKVKIVVDMNSLSTTYGDLTTTLESPDWFNNKLFPQAVFSADQFTKTGDKQYEAKGTLTIRDKSIPVTLAFTAEQPTADTAVVKGSTTLQRTAFGVGQGEWASTREVKDDVKVNFEVHATK